MISLSSHESSMALSTLPASLIALALSPHTDKTPVQIWGLFLLHGEYKTLSLLSPPSKDSSHA